MLYHKAPGFFLVGKEPVHCATDATAMSTSSSTNRRLACLLLHGPLPMLLSQYP